MKRPDLTEITKKYQRLFTPKSDQNSKVPKENTYKRPAKSSADVHGGFLDSERFIRKPIQKMSPPLPQEELGYEHYMVNSLFSAVDRDEYSDRISSINNESAVLEKAKELDILAAGLAWRLIQYDKDLMQMYDPSMGMFPTQAFYTPKGNLFRWAGSKEKPIHIRENRDPKKGKAKGEVEKKAHLNKWAKKTIRVFKQKEESEEDEDEHKEKRSKFKDSDKN